MNAPVTPPVPPYQHTPLFPLGKDTAPYRKITSEGVGRNAAELLRKIKAAKYWRENPGQVCPAKWEEGAETLAPSIDLVGKI